MNFAKIARDNLREGTRRLRAAREALDRGELSFGIRLSLEAIELGLKAALRWINVDVPKRHDVGEELRQFRDRFPRSFSGRLDAMAKLSEEAARLREPAMYGLESEGITSAERFRDPAEARRLLLGARGVIQQVQKLVRDKPLR